MNRLSSTYSSTISNPALIGVEISVDSTGKELDEETGYGYFGARYYDATLLTGWTAVDPMSDKYPNISPYAYCAWNPIKLVDPDGREIWIHDEGKDYYFKNGHVYTDAKHTRLAMDTRLSSEGKNILSNLNAMGESKAGKKVISRLTKSNEVYSIAADAKSGDGNYRSASNRISLARGSKNNLEALSHELFHAYQDDNGRIPHTIYNEVEAYVFSGIITKKSTLGMKSTNNPEYNKQARNMTKGFDVKIFNYLVSHFRSDAAANRHGDYKNYEYNPGHYTPSQSLLKDL